MTAGPHHWASANSMEARTEGLEGIAQLAGYPLFPVPITSIDGVAHGASIAQVLRRTLDTYGPRLPRGYARLLGTFAADIEALHSRYESHDLKRPFRGLGHSATILEPFFVQAHYDEPWIDALRLWLLSAVYQLTADDSKRGTVRFLQRLSDQIILQGQAEQAPTPVLDAHIQDLHSGRKIRKDTAEGLATHFGFHRAPSRQLAIHTLTSIRCSRPIKPVAGTTLKPGQKEPEPPSRDTPDPTAPSALDLEAGPDQEEPLAKYPTSYRQRFYAALVPDTEASLATDEARALYDALTRSIVWRIQGPNDLCDLILALMLTTSRDACTIINALTAMQGESEPLADDAHATSRRTPNPIRIMMHGWCSTPDHGLGYATADTDGPYQVAHSKDVHLPHPESIRRALSAFARCPISPRAITRHELEQRVREHKATVPSVSQERIRRTLPVLLFMVTGHPRTAQLIEGTDGFGSAAPTAYYAPLQSRLANDYAYALHLADIVIHTHDPLPGEDDPRVGAPRAALDGEIIHAQFTAAGKRVLEARRTNQHLDDLVHWHDQLVLHTALMYAAATAHRASFALAATRVTDITRFEDGQAGMAYIADKKRHGVDRVAALPAVVLDQLDQLLATADELRARLRTQLTPAARHAAERLEQAIVGDAPIFVRIHPKTWKPQATRAPDLEAFSELPYRMKRLRHWFATRSEELGIPGADIAQQMGHRIDGEPYSDTDPDCPWHFARRMGSHLERYLADIGLAPIPIGRAVAKTPAQGPTVAELAKDPCTRTPDRVWRRENRKSKIPESGPHSVIHRCHIRAYRLALQLETVLIEILTAYSVTVSENPQHERWVVAASLLLLPLWGVTTNPTRLRRILKEGRLVRVDGIDNCCGLVLQDAETIDGLQLISPDQAIVLQRAIQGTTHLSRSDVTPQLLHDYPEAVRLLGTAASLETVCHLASAARRLTVPGQRAAWERGDIRASGPRPSRLLSLTMEKRVRPLEAPSPPADEANAARSLPTGSLQETFGSLRRSIHNWEKQRGAATRMTQVLDEAQRLLDVTPSGSIPHLAAHAVRSEIHNRGKTGSLEPSSISRYLRHLKPLLYHSIRMIEEDTGAQHDHTGISEFLIDDWVDRIANDTEPAKALRWVARTNRGRSETLPPNINARLDDLDLGCDTPPRAGDPISAAEHTWLLRHLEPGSIPYVTGRTVPEAIVAPLALAIQAIFALRTSELTHLTLVDYFPGHHRLLVRIRERTNHPIKSLASIRTIAFRPTPTQKRWMTDRSQRVHGTSSPTMPAQHDLLPGPPAMGPVDWMASIQKRFLVAGQTMMSTAGRIPVRPHSYRHNFATAQLLALMPRYFEGIDLHLPYAESRIPHSIRSSMRSLQQYVSRQLGHGHPLTTLTHYAHHIPLMSLVRDGWARLSSATIAKMLSTTPASLRNSISRRRKQDRPEQSAVIDRLRLPALSDHYILDSYPDPNPSIEANLGDDTQAFEPHAERSEPSSLMTLTITAIGLREGRDAEEIACAQGRRIGHVRREASTLTDTAHLLGLTSTLSPTSPLRRKSRADPLREVMERLALLPTGALHSIALKLHQGKYAQRAIEESISPPCQGETSLPTLGPIQLRLTLIIIHAYLSTTN